MRRFFQLVLALVFPLLISIVSVAWWYKALLDSELHLQGREQIYRLRAGAGFSTAVDAAAEHGWIRYPRMLKMYGRLVPSVSDVKAGEYNLVPGLTIGGWLHKMQRGDVVSHQATLVEGRTLSQALVQLNALPWFENEELPDDHTLWEALAISSPMARSPEGLFFPDTYHFHRGESLAQLLRRAYEKMQTVLEQEWSQRALGLPYETPYDALIMASIVEKETGHASERAEIAGVFVRRLMKGMRLQTDPTVIYGIGDPYDGNLRRSDLRNADNPYNTYRHHGLPPTPIALPGQAAIHAALHPADGDALYFVARGDGSHQFSATLDEHQEAVRRYQIEQRRSNYRSSPARDGSQ